MNTEAKETLAAGSEVDSGLSSNVHQQEDSTGDHGKDPAQPAEITLDTAKPTDKLLDHEVDKQPDSIRHPKGDDRPHDFFNGLRRQQALHQPTGTSILGVNSTETFGVEMLWDEAYGYLMDSHPKLMARYENILSQKISNSHADHSSLSGENFDAHISPDAKTRRSQMKQLINTWGEDPETTDHSTEDSLDSEPALGPGGYIPPSLKRELYERARKDCRATIAWAAIFLASEGTLCLLPETDIDHSDLVYVLLRMEWYSQLPKLILNHFADDSEATQSREQNGAYRRRLLNLYMAILLRLVGIVCQQKSWPADAQPYSQQSSVLDAEKDLATFEACGLKQQIEELTVSNEQNRRHITDPFVKLHAIDPRTTMPDFGAHQTPVIDHALQWLQAKQEYADFRDWDKEDSQLLLITGSVGTAKSILLSTAVQDLSHVLPADPVSGGRPNVVYYCCGSESPFVASMLKSIIGTLLIRQPSLIYHLNELYESTNRKHFDHPNDFSALAGLLCHIIHDEDFIGAYVVVDSIDDCNFATGWPQLQDLLHLITLTTAMNRKVRWLVSSGESDNLEALSKYSHLSRLNLSAAARDMGDLYDLYLIQTVSALAEEKGYNSSYESTITDAIRRKAKCNFLWTSIVYQLLQKAEPWHAIYIVNEVPANLESLYDYIFEGFSRLPYDDSQAYYDILHLSASISQPLSLPELAALVEIPNYMEPINIINACPFFLEVRNNLVYFKNTSARTYVRGLVLQDSNGSDMHSSIIKRCLHSVSRRLETRRENLVDTRDLVGESPPDALSSSKFIWLDWTLHMCKIGDSKGQGETITVVTSFLEQYILEWINSLAAHQWLSSAVVQFRALLLHLKSNQDTSDGQLKTIEDSYRLLYLHESSNAPHWIPASNSLIFCPDVSIAKKRHKASLTSWVTLPPMDESWDPVHYELRGHKNWIRSIAFSPDGHLFASASDDRTVRLWDSVTGLVQRVFEGHTDWVTSVAISSQGLLASGSDDSKLRVWNIISGKLLYARSLGVRPVKAASFSPDGSTMVTASSGFLNIWDTAHFESQQLGRHDGTIHSVVFSPDGMLLASACNRSSIKLWDVKNLSGKPIREIESPSSSLTFSLNGQTILSSHEKVVFTWDVSTGIAVRTLYGSTFIVSISLSPNGKVLATANDDGSVSMLDVADGNPKCILRSQRRLPSTTAVSFSPRGPYVASSGQDAAIRFWYSPAGEVNAPTTYGWQNENDYISTMAISPDEKMLAIAQHSNLILWEIETQKQELLCSAIGDMIDLAFSPDGKQLAVSARRRDARIYDTVSGKVIRRLETHGNNWVRQAKFSHNGKYVATASNRLVQIWDLTSLPGEKPPRELKAHDVLVCCVAFSPDGKYLAFGGDDCKVYVWDCETWEQKCVLKDHPGRVVDITFFPDSRRILSASWRYHAVWDLDMSEIVAQPIESDWPYRGISLDPAAPEYVMTSQGVGKIWKHDVAAPSSATDCSPLSGTEWSHYRVIFSPDHGERHCWVMWKDRKVIFIPGRYKPSLSLVAGHHVFIGCSTGQLISFAFTPGVVPPEMASQ